MTKSVRSALMLVSGLAGLAPGLGLAAQDLSFSAAAEAGGDEVHVLFAQPQLSFGPDRGLRPFLSLGAHYVIVDQGDNSWGVTPAGGLKYQTSGGMISGSLGWAIADDDVNNGFDVFAGGESGLHTGVHTEFWGSGAWAMQGIATYNWGSDFLWSRARLLKRIKERSGGGGILLGGELAWQAQTEDDDLIDDNEYQATQIGPVLQFTSTDGPGFSLSGGWKMTETSVDNDTWYAKVELYLP
jgi:hypothetical protein